MSVQIHTEDPISPTKASRITPQTSPSSNDENPSQPRQTTRAVAPTPTSTVPQSCSYGPPAPQPGVAPVPLPPTITTRSGVPPPPKAGEKQLSPEHYAPIHSTPAPPQPYPSQMQQPPVDHALRAIPPGSTTSTSVEPSLNTSSQPSNNPSSTDMPARASLEHPPGYVQNPFASDMTPDQRFAAQQQQENQSDTLPSLGYTDNSKGARTGLEDEQRLGNG